MKKTTAVIAVLLVVLTLCCLTSCAKTLNGTYSDSLNVTSYTFSGSKVTYKASLLGIVSSREGSYTINTDSGEITLTFEGDSTISGTFTFSENKEENTITIGLLTYTKN